MRTTQQRSDAMLALAGAVATLAEEVRMLIDSLDRLREEITSLKHAITEDYWKPVLTSTSVRD